MDKFEEASEGWQMLFLKYPTVGDIILQHLDSESALACRLVCKGMLTNTINIKTKTKYKVKE